jgi:glycosyltransferase involved in cell wall biosynthesis
MRRLRILTWHVHGSYLFYLAQAPHDFYLPVKADGPEGFGGRAGNVHWPENLHDIPAEEVRRGQFDCILFQSHRNYMEDQHAILSPSQRRLPRIFLEHDPPRQHPTDTRHPIDDPNVLLVHVTPFNALMWDNNRTPTLTIDHGVSVPADAVYTGAYPRGIAVVNGLGTCGRRLGADIFTRVRQAIPLDLVGLKSYEFDGLGEIKHQDLPGFEARYRFFFNPIRYTSLGLAVCEAMMVGMPIIGLATTEMACVVENGVSGYVDTNLDRLIRHMDRLLNNLDEARHLGEGARRYARQRFGIDRFVRDWNHAFALATGVDSSESAAMQEPIGAHA